MTIEEADKQSANPNYSVDKSYRINCQTCAPAYMLRLWGFDVKAKGNTPGSLSEWLSSEDNSFKAWKNIDGSPVVYENMSKWMRSKGWEQMSKKRYLDFFEEKCKSFGVYLLTISWKGRGGHATILQRLKNGNLVYVEPQSFNGSTFRDVSELAEDGAFKIDDFRGGIHRHKGDGVLRIDDKLFDKNYLSIFDK